MSVKIYPISRLQGNPKIPGDKSISHRSLILGAIARGRTEILNLLESEDVLSTWNTLRLLGVEIARTPTHIRVDGRGAKGFQEPTQSLDCGNSGTTFRLLMGLLSQCEFSVVLTGDPSLSRRPMARIAQPLSKMGASFQLTRENYAPIHLTGSKDLVGISFELPTSSAQLKSALLLAGLFAEGTTRLSGKIQSRDHTEKLLPYFGAELSCTQKEIILPGKQSLQAAKVEVPGDLSSAAFWIAAAVITPGSQLDLENVSLNPTRTGFLDVLKRMGAQLEIEFTSHSPEPIGRIRVRHSPLQSVRVAPEEVPFLIDELPLLAVLALFAEGKTHVEGAQELRIKETDRIEAIASNIRNLKCEIETRPDGFSIQGPQPIHEGTVDSFHDHRIAMAMSIAALQAKGPIEVLNSECVSISYPTFYSTLRELSLNPLP
jgi:3-phosphoshikimate 1-carboxyvinyltransferase